MSIRAFMLACAVLVTLVSGPAFAGDEDAFEVEWAIDVPVAIAGGLAGGAMHLLQDELVPVPARCARPGAATPCDGEALNALDATVRGRYSAPAHTVGNVLLASAMVLGPTVSVLGAIGGEHDDAWLHALEDAVIIGEVLGVSVFVHQATVFATRRPRPYAYGNTAPAALRAGADAYLSFYSGHTANAFAVASASSYLFTRRHPNSPWVVPLWTFSHGLAVLQGTSRVMAGYHFWSDVLVGAAVGSSLGLAIPYLHQSAVSDQVGFSVMPVPGGAAASLWLQPTGW